ncbi:restriction endonuclease [Phenylobacterium sp.]|jgi:restriction system protein|uniref:restriction endonuclease n=1 Tax=Phenylobacterium sp. TaxID=1871053 RepID=UPI0035B0C8B8
MTRLWIVRAGRHGERELDAITQGRLLPGFNELGDLSGLKDRDAISGALAAADPQGGKNTQRNFAAQLNQFVNTIAVGDLVVLPRKVTSGVAIGRVTGPYAYQSGGVCPHTRAVDWLNEAVPREAFAQDLRHSFGAFMTICEVKRNEALARVEAVIKTGKDPGPLLGKQGVVSVKAPVEDAEAEDVELDVEDIARQQIIALIKSAFAGHDLANLVAEILRIEGYVTKVSPPGPDGGVDILAAGGRLGLGEDRICVQVKSGDAPANQEVVLKLMGSVQAAKARTGLLVSIAGVNGAAQKLIDNEFFSVRLWQMPELLTALFASYSQLSDETRAEIPLKQIWAPVAGVDA